MKINDEKTFFIELYRERQFLYKKEHTRNSYIYIKL